MRDVRRGSVSEGWGVGIRSAGSEARSGILGTGSTAPSSVTGVSL